MHRAVCWLVRGPLHRVHADQSRLPLLLGHEPLIPRARSFLADEFLRSDASHLFFIDADIGFDPKAVITMLGMMSDDRRYVSDRPVIA
jgi:hypothetical protein